MSLGLYTRDVDIRCTFTLKTAQYMHKAGGDQQITNHSFYFGHCSALGGKDKSVLKMVSML